MKTLIREQIGENSGIGILIMTWQILIKKYKDSDALEPIGHISFQQNKGENTWYAMKGVVESDEAGHFQKMAKLLKHIKNNRSNWDAQPDEIRELIGAVDYKVFDHQFVPVSKNGENIYSVMTEKDSLYTTIIAASEEAAQKILDKKNIPGTRLEYKKEIVL